MSIENSVWVEKYRPTTVADTILPEQIKSQVEGIIKTGDMQSLLFTGPAGCGKTTLARAMANELGADFMQINASRDGNIDLIRNKLSQFASTVSFSDSRKITLLDEADGLTPLAQQALRGFVEEFSANHSIIFTCNFTSKLIEPIRSRCKIIDFKSVTQSKLELSIQFTRRVMKILEQEGVKYDKKVVAEYVMKNFPDFRSILNEMQGYSKGGDIDAGILLNFSEDLFNALIEALKHKKFNDVRKWAVEHADIDPVTLFRTFYDTASEKLQPKSIPEMILLLGEYSYKSAFVADQDINTMAFLTSILLNPGIEWK